MIENTLRKLSEKHQGHGYFKKKLDRTTPLFMIHDFWGTQPVPNYFDCLPMSMYN